MDKFKTAINWFEIPALDFQRAVRFYSDIFAYELPTRDMGQLRMGFFQHESGVGTGGAIVCGDGYQPSEHGSKLYLNAGNDLLPVLERVESAGGTVNMGKTEISPEVGYFAILTDTEGNRIFLHSMN